MSNTLRLWLGALLLCSGIAFAQQQPQWTVIAAVKVVNQTAPIAPVTLFTPTQTLGLYRVTAYIAEKGPQHTQWRLNINYTDSTGVLAAVSISVEAGEAVLDPTPFSPKPGTPVSYDVDLGSGEVPYSFMFAIEQLKLPSTR